MSSLFHLFPTLFYYFTDEDNCIIVFFFLLVLEISETMSKVPSNTGLHN